MKNCYNSDKGKIEQNEKFDFTFTHKLYLHNIKVLNRYNIKVPYYLGTITAQLNEYFKNNSADEFFEYFDKAYSDLKKVESYIHDNIFAFEMALLFTLKKFINVSNYSIKCIVNFTNDFYLEDYRIKNSEKIFILNKNFDFIEYDGMVAYTILSNVTGCHRVLFGNQLYYTCQNCMKSLQENGKYKDDPKILELLKEKYCLKFHENPNVFEYYKTLFNEDLTDEKLLYYVVKGI